MLCLRYEGVLFAESRLVDYFRYGSWSMAFEILDEYAFASALIDKGIVVEHVKKDFSEEAYSARLDDAYFCRPIGKEPFPRRDLGVWEIKFFIPDPKKRSRFHLLA